MIQHRSRSFFLLVDYYISPVIGTSDDGVLLILPSLHLKWIILDWVPNLAFQFNWCSSVCVSVSVANLISILIDCLSCWVFVFETWDFRWDGKGGKLLPSRCQMLRLHHYIFRHIWELYFLVPIFCQWMLLIVMVTMIRNASQCDQNIYIYYVYVSYAMVPWLHYIRPKEQRM